MYDIYILICLLIYTYVRCRWIDITYLSESLRVTRGNKGTTFVLKRVIPGSADDDGAARLAASNDLKALREERSAGDVTDSEVNKSL